MAKHLAVVTYNKKQAKPHCLIMGKFSKQIFINIASLGSLKPVTTVNQCEIHL